MTLRAGIIKRCLEECETSTYRFRMGAVIFNKKAIISSGHNDIRSSSIPDGIVTGKQIGRAHV